ncbi:MAG TPA: hypothetical protein VKV38_05740 [Trebonia sp.]|jgi:hypothetical protein|nr:hypothetical protein [Trebonia sp.]
MPDSLPPPSWGSAPFDERDLDAVLSGETADIADALRPVADTLAALRAPGVPAELSGEAAVMAEFRALGRGDAARPAVPATTLQLPVIPAVRPLGRAARHRGRRRAASRARRQAVALIGIAVTVIVLAVAFAGNNLLGPMGRASTASRSSARPAEGDPASPGLQARGAVTERPSPARSAHATPSRPSPSPSSSSPGPGTMCRAYFGYLGHREPPGSWPAESPLLRELSQLAGGLSRVPGYCGPYLRDWFPYGGRGSWQRYPGAYLGTGDQGNQPQERGPGQPGQDGPGPGYDGGRAH